MSGSEEGKQGLLRFIWAEAARWVVGSAVELVLSIVFAGFIWDRVTALVGYDPAVLCGLVLAFVFFSFMLGMSVGSGSSAARSERDVRKIREQCEADIRRMNEEHAHELERMKEEAGIRRQDRLDEMELGLESKRREGEAEEARMAREAVGAVYGALASLTKAQEDKLVEVMDAEDSGNAYVVDPEDAAEVQDLRAMGLVDYVESGDQIMAVARAGMECGLHVVTVAPKRVFLRKWREGR